MDLAWCAHVCGGSHFAGQLKKTGAAPVEPVVPATSSLGGTELSWLARILGNPTLRAKPNADDIKLLCTRPDLWGDPEELAAFARQHGLLLFKKAAAALTSTLLTDSKMWTLLQQNGIVSTNGA
jgi:hypothetical protein